MCLCAGLCSVTYLGLPMPMTGRHEVFVTDPEWPR